MEKKTYKESPSQIGRIMTNPRSKSEVLSETCKTRVEEKFIEDQFGVRKSFWSKETNKGLECEIESINFFVKEYDLFGAKKNEIRFENESFVGTPDLVFNSVVYDIKTSWSLFTYPMFDDPAVIPTKDYMFQLQAYLDLTGLKKAQLVYVLTNATEEMIQDEVYRRCLRSKVFDKAPEVAAMLEDEIDKQVRKEMTFNHVDSALRVKTFDIEYDPAIITEIKARIELCEEYYNALLERIANQINTKTNGTIN
jgi:hypothetical protein